MIRIYLITLIASFTGDCLAQTKISAEWLRHTCGYTNGVNLLGGNVWGDAVCTDKFGNSYNSGSFSGNWFTMDTVIEMLENRFYINKYNAQGQRLWTAKAKGTTINSIMTPTKMECDSFGNVYICGIFSVDDSVYMAPNWYPIGSGFVAKYDANGNNIWCSYVPRTGTTSISFTDMSINDNHIYVCGNMGFGTQSFGGFSFNSTQSQNGIIAKLDLNGKVLQAEQIDPNSVNEVYGIESSANSNNVYLVGQYISSRLNIDGIQLILTDGATNSFILKMDKQFSSIWLKKGLTYLHPNQTVGFSVPCFRKLEIDQFENLYVLANGNGDSTVIGNLRFAHRISPNGNYAQDIYLVKLNSNGQELWLRHGGSDEMDVANDIITDKWGNSTISVYSGRQSLSGLIFSNDTISQWHGALVKYDPWGNIIYTQKLQEARSIKALALGIDSSFYGTGTGFNPGIKYVNLSIPECEDTLHGYYNPPFKMVMVKFHDETGDFTSSIVSKPNITEQFVVYPNPTSAALRVDFKSNNSYPVRFKVISSTGVETLKGLLENKNSYIDTNDLVGGLYILNLEAKGQVLNYRFVKE